jgi:ABC-2 type transport system permease protein
MYVALFPEFSSVKIDFIQNMPQGFLKAFNFDPNSFITVQGFLATEQFSLVWPMLAIALVIGFSGFAIAGEVEKGTIEFLLAEPISRARLFVSRYLAGLLMLVIFVVFSILVAIPLCQMYHISFTTDHFYTMALLSFLFGLAIYSLGMMFTAIFSDKGKVFFASIGVIVVMYVINIVSSLRDSLVNLKYASFFYYYSPPKALVYNQIDHWSYLIFIGVAVICTIVGAIYFTKRDIAT